MTLQESSTYLLRDVSTPFSNKHQHARMLGKEKIVFLSNAPRPSLKVVQFLKKMKMDEKLLKNVLTSGEAAMNSLKKNKFGKKFYHLGPERDDSLFSDIKMNKPTIEKCDFILCTGLFDEQEENLKYYEELLKKRHNSQGEGGGRAHT